MFNSLDSLLNRFRGLGAVHAFCKPLAENDNSKQQIYLGGSLDSVQMFRFERVESQASGKNSTYKAKLDFHWIGEHTTENAPGAQLILYPAYPEVRLSGFLRGCRNAPNELLRPIPASSRLYNNGPDGRILFFGTTADGRTLAHLAPADSDLANEFRARNLAGEFPQESVFLELPLFGRDSKTMLLTRLAEIRDAGWHASIRLRADGSTISYRARNGGGYTLEALLGIIPNGRSEPDYLGWELKACGGSRITLMTPEPDGGFYGEEGVKAFVKMYGRPTGNDVLYFTGTHKANQKNDQTGLTLVVRGFDTSTSEIADVNGAIELVTDEGVCAAAWSFSNLMIGWNRKHSQAAYVPYESRQEGDPAYRYFNPAMLGEGTDVTRYLAAVSGGLVIFDPGSKIENASTGRPTVKARSQFRMNKKNLATLYRAFQAVDF